MIYSIQSLNKTLRHLFFFSITSSFLALSLFSCSSLSDVTLIQDKGNTIIDSGYIVYHQEEYLVRPNDIINIYITSLYPTLKENISSIFSSTEVYPVNQHGSLDMPLLGKIDILGKNLDEVKALILDALAVHFQRDKVFVRVTMGGTYSVVGEMNQTFPVGTVRPVNLLEAISRLRQISPTADLKNIELIRQGKNGAIIHTLDITDRSIMNKPYFWLQPKDIIHVKPTSQKVSGFGATGYSVFTTVTRTITTLTGLITTYLFIEDRLKNR